MAPEYDESDAEETCSLVDFNYPYVDDQGHLHLKNSNSSVKSINGSRNSISSELNDKTSVTATTSEKAQLLKEHKRIPEVE